MKNSRNLALGEADYLSVIYRIPDSWPALFIVWLRFSVLITWLVKTENRWHMVSIPIKIEFDYPKRNCVTTVWIYKGLYGNATVLLEKSILLMFCEKNLLLLCCIPCCLLHQLLTRLRDLVVLWHSGPHDHFLRLFFLGSAVITMIYNQPGRTAEKTKGSALETVTSCYKVSFHRRLMFC